MYYFDGYWIYLLEFKVLVAKKCGMIDSCEPIVVSDGFGSGDSEMRP